MKKAMPKQERRAAKLEARKEEKKAAKILRQQGGSSSTPIPGIQGPRCVATGFVSAC